MRNNEQAKEEQEIKERTSRIISKLIAKEEKRTIKIRKYYLH
jgi:hypothetical protein